MGSLALPAKQFFHSVSPKIRSLRLLRKIMAKLYAFMRECDRDVYAEYVRSRYQIHPTVRWGDGTKIYGDGAIAIGERTYLGNNCYIASHPAGAKITIGRCCAIAHNVHFRNSDFQRVLDFKDALDAPSVWADITIGDYIWIGNHVYICAGVRVGDNSIIGANSVVTHDVEPNTVVGGVPARLIHRKSVYASANPTNSNH